MTLFSYFRAKAILILIVSGFVALVATLTVMPDLPVAGVALIVGIDRFMSEARALTSTISNAVACVVVSIWENACDRETLHRELGIDYAKTEEALDEDGGAGVTGGAFAADAGAAQVSVLH